MLRDYIFNSIFKNELTYFVKYKRGLGYKYNNEVSILMYFDNKMLFLKRKSINQKEFNKIIKIHDTSYQNYSRYYRTFISFLKFIVSHGYTNIYYEDKTFTIKRDYYPIIFINEEMKRLFNTIDNYANNSKKTFYNLYFTYSIIVRLLYSCGLRISEALNLTIDNIDIENNSIEIIDSKNSVSRIIAFSDSMKQCFEKYIKICNVKSGTLFKNRKGNKIEYHTFREYYKNMLIKANLNTNAKIHALRHVFANNAFNRMVEKGYNEGIIILYLQKYMGHKNINETEYYLHFIDYNKQKILKLNDNFSKELYKGVIE